MSISGGPLAPQAGDSWRPLPRLNSTTLAAWLIALSPLAIALLALVIGGGGAYPIVVILLGAASLPVNWLLASIDRDRLLIRGFDSAPEKKWALIPLLYLWKRDQHTSSRSWPRQSPLGVHIAIVVLLVLAFFALVFPRWWIATLNDLGSLW